MGQGDPIGQHQAGMTRRPAEIFHNVSRCATASSWAEGTLRNASWGPALPTPPPTWRAHHGPPDGLVTRGDRSRHPCPDKPPLRPTLMDRGPADCGHAAAGALGSFRTHTVHNKSED
jgi:hypothetical protein